MLTIKPPRKVAGPLSTPVIFRDPSLKLHSGTPSGTRRLSRPTTGPKAQQMRTARTCYDHIAGQLGVQIADAMVMRGFVKLAETTGLLTQDGATFLTKLGVDIDTKILARKGSRPVCRPCLDWTERRPHLAGRLGAALCQQCMTNGWIRKRVDTRSLEITPSGDQAFRELFGFERTEATTG